MSWLAPGDHVVFGFIPRVASARAARRSQNLCDLGAVMASASRSPTAPLATTPRADSASCASSARFAHHTVVNEASCIKIENDVPLDKACLLGCGVVTGWGSAV